MLRAHLAVVSLLLLGCGGTQDAARNPGDPTGRPYSEYLGSEDGDLEILSPAKEPAPGAMHLHFIDIGQGSATLVEFPCGAILVDTGGEKNALFDSQPVLLAYLDRFFKRRPDLNGTLDSLVITHPHIDHTRSIAAVLARYQVRNIVDNGDVDNSIGGKPQLEMHSWLFRKNQQLAAKSPNTEQIGHFEVSSADVGERGLRNSIISPIPACPASDVDPSIRALWGTRLGRSEAGHNSNNDSIVLRVDFGKASALLSGDLELLSIAWLLKRYKAHPEVLDADIYYVPHHGSRNSTGVNWVAKVTPRVAVMSMGPYGRKLRKRPAFTARSFGHPNKTNVDHLLDPEGGISAMRRTPIQVQVGIRGGWRERPSEFESRTIQKALYATGWDGHVVVTAHPNGQLNVWTADRDSGTDAVSRASRANRR